MLELDLESLRSEYLVREIGYKNAERKALEIIENAISQQNIIAEVESRVKNPDSFIKKIIQKNYSNPWLQIKDIIGVRIITAYEDELTKIEKVIGELFEIHERDNKIDSLEHNEFDYLGLHLEVSFLDVETGPEKEYNIDRFEIQLHSKAQNLWSSISHQLSYKPLCSELPLDIKRSIHRLVALIELFDKEVNEAHKFILDNPDFPEARLLENLERYFREFSSRRYNRDLSIRNILELKKTLEDKDIVGFEDFIGRFIDRNRDKLYGIFDDYKEQEDSYKTLLLYQPESLLIFERLSNSKFVLKDAWCKFLPLDLLEYMAAIWGEDLPID